MSAVCTPCHYEDHARCEGDAWDHGKGLVVCRCWFTHDYDNSEPREADDYELDRAEDRYIAHLHGELS